MLYFFFFLLLGLPPRSTRTYTCFTYTTHLRSRPSHGGTRIGHERPLENEPMTRTWLNPVAYDRCSFIKVEVDDNGVGTVTMNEPDKLNAIGPEQHREIEDIWLDLARDESIRTLVFTGAEIGRAHV